MLPNLIIIGAMKCGTTSLHSYLSLHPQIQMSKTKELNFFAEKYNWHKGLQWYESNFVEHPHKVIYGEASPNYTNYSISPEVPKRMWATIPQAKLIYLVRDPIERMVAHYVHQYSAGRELRKLDEALADFQGKSYFQRSLYFAQLKRFLDYYPAAQILVIATEDLRFQRTTTLRKVFDFLGVNPNFYSPIYRLEQHKSSRKRQKTALGQKIADTVMGQTLARIPETWGGEWLNQLLYLPFSRPIAKPAVSVELTQWLRVHLQADIDQLRQFTGNRFESWSV